MSELQIQTIINGREYQTEELDELYLKIAQKPRDFSHGMNAPLRADKARLFFCIVALILNVFLHGFLAHIA